MKLDPVDPIMFPVQPGESQSRRTSESADPRDHSDKDILFNHEQGEDHGDKDIHINQDQGKEPKDHTNKDLHINHD